MKKCIPQELKILIPQRVPSHSYMASVLRQTMVQAPEAEAMQGQDADPQSCAQSFFLRLISQYREPESLFKSTMTPNYSRFSLTISFSSTLHRKVKKSLIKNIKYTPVCIISLCPYVSFHKFQYNCWTSVNWKTTALFSWEEKNVTGVFGVKDT